MNIFNYIKNNQIKKMIGTMLIYGVAVDNMLFKGCENGDVDMVKRALTLGADVNATKKVGEYWDGIGRGEPSWEGTIKVTPLIYAATSAFGKADEKPYKEIVRLLAEKGADVERVVSGKEKYWDNDNFEIAGLPPDGVEPYAYSLEKVLTNRRDKKYNRYNAPYDYCRISDSMAAYMAGLFSLADKKVFDKLQSKEAFLNDVIAERRKKLDRDVVIADVTLREPLREYEVRPLREEEEKERLKANKLRIKLQKGQSR